MTVSTLRPDATLVSFGPLTGGATLHGVLSDDSDASYANVQGQADQVTFGDLTLPAGAVIKSAALRLRTARVTTNAELVGQLQDSSGNVLLSQNVVVSWASPTTASWGSITSYDGDALTDALLDGVRVELQGWSGSGVLVHEAYVDATYVELPVVTVDALTDPVTTTNQPTVSWSTDFDSDGGGQEAWQVKIFTDAQYLAGGFDPDTSSPFAESDEQFTSAPVSWQVDEILPDDTYRAYVRTAQRVNGEHNWSDWAFDEFTVDVDLPAVPDLTLTADSANARIQIVIDDNAGTAITDELELQRSLDGGVTWGTVRQEAAGNFDAADAPITVYDYEAPNGLAVQYRARALHDYSGELAASDWVTDSESWSSTSWWLKHPNQPALNVAVVIRSFPSVERAGRQGVFQSFGASFPVVVSDTRESKRGTVVLRSYSIDAQDALDALLNTSGTLLLQSPPDEGGPDYIRVLRHERARIIDRADASRVFESLEFVQVDEALTIETGTGSLGSGGGFVSTFGTRLTALESDMDTVQGDFVVVKEGALNPAYPEYGAVVDGSTDDSAAYQAVLDVIEAAGGGELLIPRGVSIVENLQYSAGTHVRGTGFGSILRLKPSAVVATGATLAYSAAHRYLLVSKHGGSTGDDGVEFDSFTLDGNVSGSNDSDEYYFPLGLWAVRDARVHDLKILNARGDGAIIGRHPTLGQDSEDVHFWSIILENCGVDAGTGLARQGVAIVQLRRGSFRGFTCDTIGSFPIDIEPDAASQIVEDIDIEGIHVYNAPSIVNVEGNSGGLVRRVSIDKLTHRDGPDYSAPYFVQMDYCEGVTVGSIEYDVAPLTAPVVYGSNVTHRGTKGAPGDLCLLSRSTSQTNVPNTTPTVIEWDSARSDQDAMHDPTDATSRKKITAVCPGIYQVNVNLRLSASSGTYRELQVVKNGTTTLGAARQSPQSFHAFAFPAFFLAQGDYIEIQLQHDEGVALDIVKDADYSPELSVVKVR